MLSAHLARLAHHLYKQQRCCETVPGKGSSRACCQNEVREHYSFSLLSLRSLSGLYFVLVQHRRNEATRSGFWIPAQTQLFKVSQSVIVF